MSGVAYQSSKAADVGPRPPKVRATPKTLRAMLDRTRSAAMFEGVARHGDVVELGGLGFRIWLVSDPALAREVLVDRGRQVTKGFGIRMIAIGLGNGILTNEDPVSHKRNRRLINPAFSVTALRKYADVMSAAAMRADERWQAGQIVEITEEMGRITLDVVGRTLLGDDTERDARTVIDSLEEILKRFGIGFIPGATKLLDTRFPPAVKIRNAVASMRSTVERVVSDHKHSDRDYDDIVAALIAATEDGEGFTEQQVLDETLTLMLAGFETTANALAWTWWLLDQNPEVAARLREEIAATIGDRAPTYDDIARLPYAMATIAETMRLRPPAWILERETLEPIDLGGYHVNAGQTLLMSPWIIHQDPRWWGADAHAYRPDRWINADGAFDHSAPGQPRGAYFPFGAGSRMCIGEQFAWSEAVLVLATLARRWAPAIVPGQRVRTWAAVTLRPHPGIKMRLEPAKVSL
ncbi:MAG TPA: cytochrome P450 [Mycobacteriales bacterium]|nr:cytochrome P450 [Mycobacteriales bacterium]